MAKNIVIIILVLLLAAAGYLAWDYRLESGKMEAQLSDRAEALASAQSETKELRRSLDDVNARFARARDALESHVKSFMEDLAARDEQIAALRERLEPLEETLQNNRDRMREILGESDSLRERVGSLSAALEERDFEIADLESQLMEVRSSLDEARRQLASVAQKELERPATGQSDGADSAQSDVFETSELDRPPRLIQPGHLAYPLIMRQERIEGQVRLKVIIDEQGLVTVTEVIDASHDAFIAPAIRSLEDSLFESPIRNGNKVKATYIVPVRFTLR